MSNVKYIIEQQERYRKFSKSLGSCKLINEIRPLQQAIKIQNTLPNKSALDDVRSILKKQGNAMRVLRENREIISNIGIVEQLKFMQSVLNQKNIYNVFLLNKNVISELKKYDKNIGKSMNVARIQLSAIENIKRNNKYIYGLNNISKLASLATTIQDSIDWDNINYDEINIDDINVNEVEDMTESIIENIEDIDCNWQLNVANSIKKWGSKRPVYFFILFTIILPSLVNNILNASIEKTIDTVTTIVQYMENKDAFISKEKQVKKYMIDEINNKFYKFKDYIFKTYRFIKIDNVYLRKSPKMKSFPITKLNKGDIVKIIRKNNHWSYVEYKKSEYEVLTGWINTRYTKRFHQ